MSIDHDNSKTVVVERCRRRRLATDAAIWEIRIRLSNPRQSNPEPESFRKFRWIRDSRFGFDTSLLVLFSLDTLNSMPF
jgi:hypothetical protein